MQCPRCKHKNTRVLDSRTTENLRSVRRRRLCENKKCNHRFTTFERIEVASFVVLKRDNTHEHYDREKIEKGIWMACKKRPVSPVQIEDMLNVLEEKWSANKKAISSSRIGSDIMDTLREIDEIAYIRFASVYKSFKDRDDFKREIERMLKSS